MYEMKSRRLAEEITNQSNVYTKKSRKFKL